MSGPNRFSDLENTRIIFFSSAVDALVGDLTPVTYDPGQVPWIWNHELSGARCPGSDSHRFPDSQNRAEICSSQLRRFNRFVGTVIVLMFARVRCAAAIRSWLIKLQSVKTHFDTHAREHFHSSLETEIFLYRRQISDFWLRVF